MLRLNEIRLPLTHTEADLNAAILRRLKIDASALTGFSIFRRAYDARKRSEIFLVYTIDVDVTNEPALRRKFRDDLRVIPTPDTQYKYVAKAPPVLPLRPVVIGLGPCGLFAALTLAEMGFKPIVLERGKAVRERTQDTWGLWRKSVLDPESNVQFGEGGAGTFSDGKLWSQIKDPFFLTRKVLTDFVEAGAPPEIMYVSKPHIGTFKLVTMVEKMRAKIEALGGEIRFQTRVIDFEMAQNPRQITGLVLSDGSRLATHHVQFSPAEQKAIDGLLAQCAAQPWNTPSVKDCKAAVSDAVFDVLVRQQKLVQCEPDVVLLPKTYNAAYERVRALIQQDGQITAAQVRDAFGTTRKYALALLEHFDSLGITKRVGDARVLK